MTYSDLNRSLPSGRLLCILTKCHVFNNMRLSIDGRVLVVQGFPNSMLSELRHIGSLGALIQLYPSEQRTLLCREI